MQPVGNAVLVTYHDGDEATINAIPANPHRVQSDGSSSDLPQQYLYRALYNGAYLVTDYGAGAYTSIILMDPGAGSDQEAYYHYTGFAAFRSSKNYRTHLSNGVIVACGDGYGVLQLLNMQGELAETQISFDYGNKKFETTDGQEVFAYGAHTLTYNGATRQYCLHRTRCESRRNA